VKLLKKSSEVATQQAHENNVDQEIKKLFHRKHLRREKTLQNDAKTNKNDLCISYHTNLSCFLWIDINLC